MIAWGFRSQTFDAEAQSHRGAFDEPSFFRQSAALLNGPMEEADELSSEPLWLCASVSYSFAW